MKVVDVEVGCATANGDVTSRDNLKHNTIRDVREVLHQRRLLANLHCYKIRVY